MSSSIPPNLSPEALRQAIKAARFQQWAYFLLFSIVTLSASVVTRKQTSQDSITSKHHWSVACTAINFTISLLVILFHFHPTTSILIIDTKIEGSVIALLLIFSAVLVGVVTDADDGVAVDSSGAVQYGNLYYFSWAALFSIALLAVSFLRSMYDVDIAGEIRTRSARLDYWSAMLVASVVILSSCVDIYGSDCIYSNGASFCSIALFGIFWGMITAIISLGIVGMKIASSAAPFVVEGISAVVVNILNAFGVYYITGGSGPGAAIGNLYYFPWINYLLSVKIVACCYEDYRECTSGATDQESPPVDDIQVEPLDVDDV